MGFYHTSLHTILPPITTHHSTTHHYTPFYQPDSYCLSHRLPRRSKMKFAAILLLVALATVSQSEAGPMKKRFLIKEINNVINGIGDFFTKAYNSAKDAVNKVASGLNFDHAVDALIPLIHSGMSVSACAAACTASAASVLGPFAVSAGVICTPLCEGALAKLEDIAG